ncbi:hypothetical protein F4780DRAFT_347076 [Xylariomycetidae sp. FL0641]|nr:hypothetical protein F4780DRAFT_347076 [Xylariomycetidae sp. FL0641]
MPLTTLYKGSERLLRPVVQDGSPWLLTGVAGDVLVCTASRNCPQDFLSCAFLCLFKTYSIHSISRLLVRARQFDPPRDVEVASKRVADTSVLLTKMIMRPPGSLQARQATARTNYLHSMYRRAGQITDGYMLYTLSLFVLEPV